MTEVCGINNCDLNIKSWTCIESPSLLEKDILRSVFRCGLIDALRWLGGRQVGDSWILCSHGARSAMFLGDHHHRLVMFGHVGAQKEALDELFANR